ncbi:hypothetical protein BDV95DRAFT_625608 [Massariosphaeria phaeospora]|uniref:Uncharacterized protein n=1 Tax=Massariosphaeria phaeospora TaxID=100035 RepID=A0A7C8ICS5_9PLEO|nr:hypothetical protein BDV95DRAFT_625608 [Massariosphaeria phaeospora]
MQEHARPTTTTLPPSPPPSPPRRRKQKPVDPFLELDTKPLPLPPRAASQHEPEEPHISVLKRIILTPFLITSFLISLALINRSDRARRHQQRQTTPARNSLLAYLTPSTWYRHFQDPEPYQDPSSTAWSSSTSTSSHHEPHAAISPRAPDLQTQSQSRNKRTSWHLHKKIRKVARLEISDAFEMRRRVIVVMVGVLVVCGVGVWLGVRWVVGWLWR